jgi:hypothetical protein
MLPSAIRCTRRLRPLELTRSFVWCECVSKYLHMLRAHIGCFWIVYLWDLACRLFFRAACTMPHGTGSKFITHWHWQHANSAA